jgi:glycosyltransferase involved in cell wall biosynthesis
MNKKIVHIIVPDSFNAPLGGMGVGSLNFINGMSDEFEFYVIGFPEQNNIKNYTGVVNVLPNTFHGSVAILASQIAYYNASVLLPKPDLIHAYDWTVYMAAVHSAQYWNVPFVASMRLSINLLSELGITHVFNIQTKDGFWINNALKEMELVGLKKANVITQVSNAYAEKFKVVEGLESKTVIVPNGIDLEKWSNFEKKQLPGNAKIKVVYIGRFVPMKNIFSLLNAQIPDEIDLIFIGSERGASPEIYQKIMDISKLKSNIHFVGSMYGQDKIDYLNSADAVIMPSLHEPFGIVALEALASNSILLSSYVDGMSDFLNQTNSIFCGTTSAEIEKALNILINMTDKQKQEMIQRGRETCELYSWDKAISKMKNAYYKALLKNSL